MDVPTTIVMPAWPMASRPEPPAEGESVQIHHYQVSRRTCSCCNPGQTTYLVRNCLGEVLSMCTAEGWARMCHVLGWHPLPGLAAGERIPNGYDSAEAGGEQEAAPKGGAGETESAGSEIVNRHTPVSSPAAAVPHPESPTPADADPQIGLF